MTKPVEAEAILSAALHAYDVSAKARGMDRADDVAMQQALSAAHHRLGAYADVRDRLYEARHVLMCYNVDHGDAEDLCDKLLAIIGERDG